MANHHMRRSAFSAGRPGGLITEITWKAGKWLPIIYPLSIPILRKNVNDSDGAVQNIIGKRNFKNIYIKEDKIMAITGVSNYNSVYENIYASSRKEAAKKEETKETAAAQKSTETAEKNSKSNNATEYANGLAKLVPSAEFRIGDGFSTAKTGITLRFTYSDGKYVCTKDWCIFRK